MEWRWCLRRREGHEGAVAWTNWLMELSDGGFGSAVSQCPGRRVHGGRTGNAKMERSAMFTEHFLKNAIRRSMVMTDSTYSTRQPG